MLDKSYSVTAFDNIQIQENMKLCEFEANMREEWVLSPTTLFTMEIWNLFFQKAKNILPFLCCVLFYSNTHL